MIIFLQIDMFRLIDRYSTYLTVKVSVGPILPGHLSYHGVGENTWLVLNFYNVKCNKRFYHKAKKKIIKSLSGLSHVFTYLDIWLGAWVHAFFFQALLIKDLDLIDYEQYLKNVECSIIAIMFGLFSFAKLLLRAWLRFLPPRETNLNKYVHCFSYLNNIFLLFNRGVDNKKLMETTGKVTATFSGGDAW